MPDIVLYNVKSKIRLWGGTLAEIGMTREKIEQAMKFAISNKKAIQESPKAGCYYCKKTYKPSKVVEFLEHEETGLVWEVGNFETEMIAKPETGRWGVYSIAFPKIIETEEDLIFNFRSVLPELKDIHQKVKSANK